MVCCGSHNIRSRLTLSMPAARVASSAARARAASWMRPRRRNSSSRNDCTPMLTRFTPADRYAVIASTVTVSGLASSVTSASGESANAERQVSMRLPISSGDSSDGVPPPK